jgi:hypothetical protein
MQTHASSGPASLCVRIRLGGTASEAGDPEDRQDEPDDPDRYPDPWDEEQKDDPDEDERDA